jgi:2-methylcitrate dehydratase PrpD
VSDGPLAVRLAEDAVAVRDGYVPVPDEVLERARVLLQDFVGVALGGVPEESSGAVRAGLALLGTRGDATVLGTVERLAPPHAALANGAAAHAIEMDDTHQGGSIHLGAAIFPAALAAAELAGAGGGRVLAAAVAGYEVAARLAMAVGPAAHYRRGFHPTATCGAFGAATAAGCLLGLDVPRLAAALGIAGTQASGSMEFLTDGAWTKRLHPGWAASSGLHAAALAAAGFRAPVTAIEGPMGFLHAYSEAPDPAPVRAPRDGFELMRTGVKPHACCRYMQGPIDVALELKAAVGAAPATVERIEVGMLGAGIPIVCEPMARKRRPRSAVDAQFSLPFGVAVALVDGRASPAEFVAARYTDPAIVDLMDRVDAVPDPALDAAFPRRWPAWMRIRLRDGRVLEGRVARPLGDPENFPPPSVLDAKFRSLAGRVLDARGVERLATALRGFPSAPDPAALLGASVPTVT